MADGTLDGYIAQLLESKLKLVQALESDELPEASVLKDLQAMLQKLGPALLQEVRAGKAQGAWASSSFQWCTSFLLSSRGCRNGHLVD